MTEDAAYQLTIGQTVMVELPGEKLRKGRVRCIDGWRYHIGVIVGESRKHNQEGRYFELPFSKVQLDNG